MSRSPRSPRTSSLAAWRFPRFGFSTIAARAGRNEPGLRESCARRSRAAARRCERVLTVVLLSGGKAGPVGPRRVLYVSLSKAQLDTVYMVNSYRFDPYERAIRRVGPSRGGTRRFPRRCVVSRATYVVRPMIVGSVHHQAPQLIPATNSGSSPRFTRLSIPPGPTTARPPCPRSGGTRSLSQRAQANTGAQEALQIRGFPAGSSGVRVRPSGNTLPSYLSPPERTRGGCKMGRQDAPRGVSCEAPARGGACAAEIVSTGIPRAAQRSDPASRPSRA
jgi:hypothetical protein